MVFQTAHTCIVLPAVAYLLFILVESVNDISNDGAVGHTCLNKVFFSGMCIGTRSAEGKPCDAVAEEVSIGIEGVGESVGRGVAVSDGEFHTPVLQRGSVAPCGTAFAKRCKVCGLDEHVLHLLEIDVDGTEEPVVEECEVHTGIVLYGGLPLEVGVFGLGGTESGGEDARALEIEVVGCGCDAVVSVVGDEESVAGGVGDGLVSGLTPRQTNLEVVEPVFLEVFRQAVSQSCGRERTVTVVASEAGATVTTDGERSQQELIPVVVDLAEEGCQVIARCDTRCTFRTRSGIRPHIFIVFQGEHFGIARIVIAVLVMELHTHQDAEMMVLPKSEVVVGCV